MSDWTHPICDPCWNLWQPGRQPVRFKPDVREIEHCCFCGKDTRSGIYARHDPRELVHHGGHE